jgi:hypothetical protein
MSINNRHVLAALGFVAAAAGVLGTAGLSFDGGFESRNLVYTLPFAIGAAVASLRAPRLSAALLFGLAAGAFVIEAWTAYVNRPGCTIFLEFASSLGSVDSVPPGCSPIGVASLAIASIAGTTAALLLVSSTRNPRGFVALFAGIVLAPLLLYLLSIATFAIGGA